MKILGFLALALSFLATPAMAEGVSTTCATPATEYAFAKYADDDFDYIEAISEARAIDSVEQNNTSLSENEINAFRELADSGEYEFYEVSAGGIGDFIVILTYLKSDCAYVSTTTVFEE